MTTTELLNHVGSVLQLPPDSLTIDDTPDTVEQWDSMGHLDIIATLESLGVSVEDEEMRVFRSLRELISELRDRGVVED